MARYILHSYNKNGPFYGAIYVDGDVIKAWGAYRNTEIYEDPRASKLVVRESARDYLSDPDSSLDRYRMESLYNGFEVSERNDNADPSVFDRLDGLDYQYESFPWLA